MSDQQFPDGRIEFFCQRSNRHMMIGRQRFGPLRIYAKDKSDCWLQLGEADIEDVSRIIEARIAEEKSQQDETMASAWRLTRKMDKAETKPVPSSTILSFAADTLHLMLNVNPTTPTLHEVASAFGHLIHFAVRQGWSAKDVENALMIKLQERITFEESEAPNADA